MTPFPEARARVMASVAPLGTERVPLASILGRVATTPWICPFDVPGFDNSAVDGYALRASDNGPRKIVGESAAGGAVPPAVEPGTAVRIFTGAPLPEGADAIVMQEDAEVENGFVTLTDSLKAGDFVRYQAEEIAAGTSFDFTGVVITPPLVGLAASFGLTKIEVVRLPRAIVVGTGDELVPVGGTLGPGQVFASNPEATAAALRAVGFTDVQTRLVGDDPEATRKALEESLDAADVLIVCGGMSVGDHDHVRSAWRAIGVEETLWRIAMRPGKPFGFGMRGEKAVFGLPGNPVSALVTFAVLVRPALRKMLGLKEAEEEISATLGTPIERTDLRYEFARATLAFSEAGWVANPVTHQGSHMQSGLAEAGALIHLPDGLARVDVGTTVRVTPLRWGLV